MEGTTTQAGVMSETHISEVSTALTGAINSVLDNFVDLLPIIALIVGAIWGIRFVKKQFNRVGHA